MTWALWHTMMRVHPIRLPMRTHLGPHPHPLLHLHCPPPVRLPQPTTHTTPADVRGKDEMRFMPTPRQPTPGAVSPEFVHTEFI